MGSSTDRAARVHSAHHVFAWMEKLFTDAPPLPPSS
jgi:hypothetical protein